MPFYKSPTSSNLAELLFSHKLKFQFLVKLTVLDLIHFFTFLSSLGVYPYTNQTTTIASTFGIWMGHQRWIEACFRINALANSELAQLVQCYKTFDFIGRRCSSLIGLNSKHAFWLVRKGESLFLLAWILIWSLKGLG